MLDEIKASVKRYQKYVQMKFDAIWSINDRCMCICLSLSFAVFVVAVGLCANICWGLHVKIRGVEIPCKLIVCGCMCVIFLIFFVTCFKEWLRERRTILRIALSLSYKRRLLRIFRSEIEKFSEIDKNDCERLNGSIDRAANLRIDLDKTNINLRRSQVSVKLAEMIIENLAGDPSKQMFE